MSAQAARGGGGVDGAPSKWVWRGGPLAGRPRGVRLQGRGKQSIFLLFNRYFLSTSWCLALG